jgi:transposase InsO family protein
LGQHRSTQRKIAKTPDDEAALTADITALALQYGRYGYRRITAMLHQAGWIVNVKRVERIWRREGLKVPHKQPKRGRLWLNDSSCVRLRPEYPNHVWSYDFVEDRTHRGRGSKRLCPPVCSRCMAFVNMHGRTRRLPRAREKVSSIANTGFIIVALTVLNTSF